MKKIVAAGVMGFVFFMGGSIACGGSLLSDAPTLLNDWTVLANSQVSVENNGAAFLPVSAGVTNRMFITNGPDTDPHVAAVSAVSGFVGANVDVGGHPIFDAGGASEGSAVKQTFTGGAGEVVTFSYNFLTGGAAELSFYSQADLDNAQSNGSTYADDYAFVAITHGGVTTVTRFADMFTAGYVDATYLPDDRFFYQTGFRSMSLTLPGGGSVGDNSYTIAFGVMDGGAALLPGPSGYAVESALLLESVDVGAAPVGVPAPKAEMAGGGMMVVLGGWRWVRSLSRNARRVALRLS